VKQKADELMLQALSLEQTKKAAYQQHHLYEDEIHSLGAQLDKVRQVSGSKVITWLTVVVIT